MKIVVLGSRGMLGHALTSSFTMWDTVGLDRDEIDITNKEALFLKLAEIQPDVIVNAAAYTNVDEAENDESTAMRVNGYAAGYLAEFCEKKNVIFVHFSTDYVFDGLQHGGYNERAVARPLNAYGQSKAFGEELICESGASYYLIRTSWLFGPNGGNFVQAMLQLAQSKNEVRVVHDQIGKPTYTIDLAEAVRALIQEKRPFGIYHLVNEDPVSWFQFAQEIFEAKRMKINVVPQSALELGRPAKRPNCSILINTKFPLLRSHTACLHDYLKTIEH